MSEVMWCLHDEPGVSQLDQHVSGSLSKVMTRKLSFTGSSSTMFAGKSLFSSKDRREQAVGQAVVQLLASNISVVDLLSEVGVVERVL